MYTNYTHWVTQNRLPILLLSVTRPRLPSSDQHVFESPEHTRRSKQTVPKAKPPSTYRPAAHVQSAHFLTVRTTQVSIQQAAILSKITRTQASVQQSAILPKATRTKAWVQHQACHLTTATTTRTKVPQPVQYQTSPGLWSKIGTVPTELVCLKSPKHRLISNNGHIA